MNMLAGSPVYSRKSDEWETPDNLFRQLDVEFAFEVDVAARERNAKCSIYFGEAIDGLAQRWAPRVCWMNPPYSAVGLWVTKAREEALRGATVVCLVPSRTDTAWWHDVAEYADEQRFIRGRVGFLNPEHSDRTRAPFPSVVLVFRPPASNCKDASANAD